MTTLYLIRHGETAWNREGRFQGSQDIPLNDEGRSQARRLAKTWDRPVDLVLSSPMDRAHETARILADTLGLPIHALDPRLAERSYGSAEGLTLAQRHERWPVGEVPGAEALESVHQRAWDFLATVKGQHSERRVLAVSHGGLINAILGLLTDNRMGPGKTLLPNTSITTLTCSPRGWSVIEAGVSHEKKALGLKV